jgi:hypothetical protein
MGEKRLVYKAKFPDGTKVRIAPRVLLDVFLRDWKYHHKLDPGQLSYAGSIAEVQSSSFYHGGDVLYILKDIPGIWHEQCLEPFGPT